jgi:putative solute:sodium symporter small subunit
VSGKSDSEGKFWKASISSLIAFFIANLIIWAALMLINASLSDELDSSVKLFGAHASHYIIQIFAIVTYIIAHSKYRAWKKENN